MIHTLENLVRVSSFTRRFNRDDDDENNNIGPDPIQSIVRVNTNTSHTTQETICTHILRNKSISIMKLSFAALAVATLPSATFAFTTPAAHSSRTATALGASTLDTPPVREAPDAGWEPEWEDREGLAPEEFMKSDMDKPDLSGMWECPLTRWDSDG